MDFENHKLIFFDDKILDNEVNIEVMMNWENEMMFEHAKAICKNGGDILEIGFGMGISANYIQSYNIRSHTIMEIHPQILEKLYLWKKDKPNIKIIEGDWFSNLDKLERYDGIFFDTFHDKNSHTIDILVNYLKEEGIFSFYNSLMNNNNYKLDCEYKNIEITPTKNNYNNKKKYSIPIYIKK